MGFWISFAHPDNYPAGVKILANKAKNEKTYIYVIRHGECAGNKEGRIRGRTDFPLNENGLLQAQALAAAMKTKGLDMVFTSSLLRARQTAEIVASAAGVPCEARDGFINICMGPWENRRKAELAVEYPAEWRTWMAEPEELRLPGAETLDDVRVRATSELFRIVEEYRGKRVAVVTHRGVLKPLLAGALGLERGYWKLHADTASYSLLTHDDVHGWCLMGLNDTHHLEGLSLVQEFD